MEAKALAHIIDKECIKFSRSQVHHKFGIPHKVQRVQAVQSMRGGKVCEAYYMCKAMIKPTFKSSDLVDNTYKDPEVLHKTPLVPKPIQAQVGASSDQHLRATHYL